MVRLNEFTTIPEDGSVQERFIMSATSLIGVLHPKLLAGPFLLAYERAREGLPWFCCHGVVLESDPLPETCVPLAPGKEMMACSRCYTVRFCGKGQLFPSSDSS